MNRRQIYILLISISAAVLLGRIMAVDRVDLRGLQSNRLQEISQRYRVKEAQLREKTDNEESIRAEMDKTWRNLYQEAMLETPLLSGNDRSRWATIRALVEPEMRVVRTLKNPDGSDRYEYVWYAIDKVQNLKGWDTIDMVKHPLADDPETGYLYSSKPPLLPTLMAIPYAIIYNVGGARITLANNPYLIVRITLILVHWIPLILTWLLLARLIERFGKTDWGRIFCVAFVCFGTFLSTFVVSLNNHLPAVFCITVAFYSAVRIVFDGETRLRYFAAAGFFAFFAVACELPALSFFGLLGLLLLCYRPKQTLLAGMPAALLAIVPFFVTNHVAHETWRPAYSKQEWYFYEYERGGQIRDSYWKNPVGIDRGEPSRVMYIIHSTVGHHGIFSLTPIWILSFIGLGFWGSKTSDPRLRITAVSILLLFAIVFVFYMAQAQPNRNYGGMSCALRWMFWFIPLLSVPMVAAVDRMSRTLWKRRIAILMLAISVFSASYPIWNPWTLPWAYYLMQSLSIPTI